MDPKVMELRIKKWIPVMEEQAKSGMGKNEWCAMHGINRTSFFRWQKRVRAYLLAQGEARPSQLPSSIPSNKEVGFIEIPSTPIPPAVVAERRFEETIKSCDAPPSIRIRYGDFSIDLNGGVDERQLSGVLRVLKYAD